MSRKINIVEVLKALSESNRLRTWGFLTIITYTYLIKSGMGPLFSLFILIPSTYISALIFFFLIESIIIPFYRWLTGNKP